MALTWTPEMGNVSRYPELEQITRDAAIAACQFFDSISAPDELPRFNGSTFCNAANASARKLVDVCMKGVPAGLSGVDVATILSTAVSCAEIYHSQGGPNGGWDALAGHLSSSRNRISGSAS